MAQLRCVPPAVGALLTVLSAGTAYGANAVPNNALHEVKELAIQSAGPSQITICGEVVANSSGWQEIRLIPGPDEPADGVYVFTVVGTPPAGISMPVLTDEKFCHEWKDPPEDVRGIRVRSHMNSKTIRLGS